MGLYELFKGAALFRELVESVHHTYFTSRMISAVSKTLLNLLFSCALSDEARVLLGSSFGKIGQPLTLIDSCGNFFKNTFLHFEF